MWISQHSFIVQDAELTMVGDAEPEKPSDAKELLSPLIGGKMSRDKSDTGQRTSKTEKAKDEGDDATIEGLKKELEEEKRVRGELESKLKECEKHRE